ncbi:MAG TPA: hypothetical protein VFS21_34395 [Roseiflexaceae bacterium]|nr:hypothetical protein [Roseiflexaceae bacterium]
MQDDGFKQSNDWFRATIAATFDAFQTLLRVREVEIGITYQEGSPFRTELYTWAGDQSYRAFFDRTLSR